MGEASGGIWKASGRHLGGILEASRSIWKAYGSHLEASGKHLGGIWEASEGTREVLEKHLAIKVSSGGHLGVIWGSSGDHLGVIWDNIIIWAHNWVSLSHRLRL